MSLALSAPHVQLLTSVRMLVNHDQRYVSDVYVVTADNWDGIHVASLVERGTSLLCATSAGIDCTLYHEFALLRHFAVNTLETHFTRRLQ